VQPLRASDLQEFPGAIFTYVPIYADVSYISAVPLVRRFNPSYISGISNPHCITMSEPIPGPPPLPIVGNIHSLDLVNSFTTFGNLADTYGMLSSLIQLRAIFTDR